MEPDSSGHAAPRLPLVSDTPASGNGAADEDEDFDEQDLFGSDGEDAAPRSGAVTATAGTSTTLGATASGSVHSARRDAAEREIEDLFGSENEGDVDERELFGSDIEDGPAIDEKELFGSDDDEAPEAPPGLPGGPRVGAPRSVAPSEPSEMDEREIFGDLSDDEPQEKVSDIKVVRRPAPSEGRPFSSLRLPSILSIEKEAFRPERVTQNMLEGYKEYIDTQGRLSTRLFNAENCIRWRFKKGPDGENLHDEDGRPQYESNARVVEWEDGTKSLFVGKECLQLACIKDNVILFEENSPDVSVCHGMIPTKFVARPSRLASRTHDMLKRTQFKKFEPIRRSLLMTTDQQAETQQLQQLEADQRRRQEKQQKRSLEPAKGGMTAEFLEDAADGGEGPSVAELKGKRPRA